MKHSNNRKEIFIAATFCIVYLILTGFYYHIDKFLTGLPLGIMAKLVLLIMIILFVRQIFIIATTKKRVRFKYYIPSIILMVTFLYAFSPIKFDSEKLKSKVVLKGCFEEGEIRAFIRLRADKSFELKWSGIPGYDEWFTGSYHQNLDTIFLNYETRLPDKFGSVVLNTGQSLVAIGNPKHNDGYISFYQGNCPSFK